MKMRWVHCARVERPTILRLAVKYQLHPLPVEDTIQLEQQSVPIVRKYNDNFFIVEQCRFAAFTAGPPHYDTVISFMTEWKVSKLHADNYDNEGQSANRSAASPGADEMGQGSPGRPLMETPLPMPVPTPGGGVVSSIQLRLPSARQDSGEEQDFFAGVVRQIQRDYSMLRSGNSSWVLWRLLDVTVDELSPILSAYRAQLRWFSSLITREEARVSKDVEKRLLRSKVELDWLQRKVRPMIKVLKHIIRDKAFDPNVTRYLEDIEDHLNTFLEEVSRIMGVCHSLRDEVNSYRDRQQQKVLYVLTLVTTLVMPTHLLTGIFGMNWQDEDMLKRNGGGGAFVFLAKQVEEATREHRRMLCLLEDLPQLAVALFFTGYSCYMEGASISPFILVNIVVALGKTICVFAGRPICLTWMAMNKVPWPLQCISDTNVNDVVWITSRVGDGGDEWKLSLLKEIMSSEEAARAVRQAAEHHLWDMLQATLAPESGFPLLKDEHGIGVDLVRHSEGQVIFEAVIGYCASSAVTFQQAQQVIKKWEIFSTALGSGGLLGIRAYAAAEGNAEISADMIMGGSASATGRARERGRATEEETRVKDEQQGSNTWSTKGLQAHKVNWTFMEGWERISDSSSTVSSSDSSSEEEPLAFSAGKTPEEAKKKISKYKAALRTVLDALDSDVDEGDHKLKKKLQKKRERVSKATAVRNGWKGWSFDVTTAYLSGENLQRNVYARAPEEGLPAVDEEPAVSGGELMQILHSAYGLVESPRLWYLRASKLLTSTPLKEMPISKSSFVASDDSQAWALLSLHVDDGLLFGSEQDERFKKLKKDINGMFTIKEWKTIPLTFLGVDLKEQQGELHDDMSNYINKISLPDLKPSAKNDTPLNPQQLTSYRQLVMRLRWPGQQSMPQLLYKALAQAAFEDEDEYVCRSAWTSLALKGSLGVQHVRAALSRGKYFDRDDAFFYKACYALEWLGADAEALYQEKLLAAIQEEPPDKEPRKAGPAPYAILSDKERYAIKTLLACGHVNECVQELFKHKPRGSVLDTVQQMFNVYNGMEEYNHWADLDADVARPLVEICFDDSLSVAPRKNMLRSVAEANEGCGHMVLSIFMEKKVLPLNPKDERTLLFVEFACSAKKVPFPPEHVGALLQLALSDRRPDDFERYGAVSTPGFAPPPPPLGEPGDFPWMTLHSAVGVHVSELGAHVDTLISTIEDKTLPLRLRLMATHWLAEVKRTCPARVVSSPSLMLAPTLLVLFSAVQSETVHEKAWEHFGLLNELRAEGFTCPNGASYDPNPVPLRFDCRLWRAARLHSEDPHRSSRTVPAAQTRTSVIEETSGICGVDFMGFLEVLVPPSPNMGYPPCLEGLTVPDGGICTPQCVSGFTPHENQMLCTDGNLSLGGTITCVPDCIAPAEISDAADIPCAEGMSLPHGGRCTPVCSNGSLPVDSSPLLCHNGQLFPSSFTCRLFRCAQPAGLFTDTYHPETPFEALKGAVTLWSETFPSALDYPAEEHCSSASSGGTGCSTCYSPLMTVEVSPDIATIDALSAVVVAFEAIQGRRLALAFEEHGCQTNRGCSLVGYRPRWAEPEASNGPVSPLELVLNCSLSGTWSPSNFECQPLWLAARPQRWGWEISEVSADWAHRWATFHTGDGDGTRVFLRVSAEVIMLVPGMPGQGAAGPPCNDTEANSSEILELPAMYFWNGMRFEESQRLEHGATLLEVFVWREQVMVLAVGGDVSSLYAMNRTQSELWLLLNADPPNAEAVNAKGPRPDSEGRRATPLSWGAWLAAWLVWPAICALPLCLTWGETAYRSVFPGSWYDEVPVTPVLSGYGVADPRNVKPLGLILGLSAVAVGQFFMLIYHFLRRSSLLGRVHRVQPQVRDYFFSEGLKTHLGNPEGFGLLGSYLIGTWMLGWMPSSYYSFAGGINWKHVAAQLLLQDLIQCIMHYGEHKISTWVYQNSHKPHHRFTNPRLFDAFDGSLVDTICMILVPLVIVARLVPANVWSYMTFGTLYANWLVLIHSEFVHPWDEVRPARGAGVRVSDTSECSAGMPPEGLWQLPSSKPSGPAERLARRGSGLLRGHCMQAAGARLGGGVSGTPACAPGEAWIGLQVQATSEVRCVHLLQSADPAYMAREVALEVIDEERGVWEVLAEYANLQGAVILNDGNYSWDVLSVPQACSSAVDCNGNGAPRGLPGSCACDCYEGFAGLSCNTCAPGFLQHLGTKPRTENTRERRQHGAHRFSGPETSFLCLEDYSFRGITPACVPNECRLGIPTKVGLIIADGCAQLRTGETCTAFCGQGLSGEPLEYECSADGYLRESKSGQVGVVPSCASSFTPVEALGRAGRTASVGLKFTVAWLAQWLALLVT
eukprot:g19575.t1